MGIKSLSRSTVVRIVAVLLGVMVAPAPSLAGPWQRFESPIWWCVCAMVAIVFLVTASSNGPRIGFFCAMFACLGIAGWKAIYFFPLHQPVEPAEFVDTPLPEVLHALSQERKLKPYRRFLIEDHVTLNSRITVTIPEGARLGESLAQIAKAANCNYRWTWYSWCGNTFPPTTIRVVFYSEVNRETRGVWELDRNRLWLRDEHGTLFTDRNGVDPTSVDLGIDRD